MAKAITIDPAVVEWSDGGLLFVSTDSPPVHVRVRDLEMVRAIGRALGVYTKAVKSELAQTEAVLAGRK